MSDKQLQSDASSKPRTSGFIVRTSDGQQIREPFIIEAEGDLVILQTFHSTEALSTLRHDDADDAPSPEDEAECQGAARDVRRSD